MNKYDKLDQFIENSRCLLDNLSGLMIFKDIKSNFVECSQDYSNFVKISKKNLIGKSDYDLPWASCAESYHQRDREALMKKVSNVLEPIPIDSNTVATINTLKRPILDNEGEVIGVIAQIKILPVENCLGEAITTLHIKDKINTSLSGCEPKDYQIAQYDKLTRRETECLFLLIRGKSAKEIARFLEISFRTVEGHIEHIKNKMCVSTRSEIFAKAIEMGMLEIIPNRNMLGDLYKNMSKWKDFLT